MFDGVLSFDGKLLRYLSKLWGLLFVGILWLITSLPIVTIGASTSALFAVVERCLVNDHGFVISSFFNHLKKEFKRNTKNFIPLLGIAIVFLMDVFYFYKQLSQGHVIGLLYITFIILLWMLFLTFTYSLVYTLKIEDSVKSTIKNSFALMIAHPKKNIVLMVSLSIVLFLAYLVPPILFLVPGIYGLLSYQISKSIMIKIGAKYETHN